MIEGQTYFENKFTIFAVHLLPLIDEMRIIEDKKKIIREKYAAKEKVLKTKYFKN
jgi:hypothetical protein